MASEIISAKDEDAHKGSDVGRPIIDLSNISMLEYSGFLLIMGISIGLSFAPNNGRPLTLAQQHDEGRRILAFLDQLSLFRSFVQVEPSGRPYFADHHADFSISHSRSMVAVSYSTERRLDAGRPLRTGCDVQYVPPARSFCNIANRFFTPTERDYIQDVTTRLEQNIKFCRIWALKECFIKLKGLSIANISQAPTFDLPRAGDDMQLNPLRYAMTGYTFFQFIYGDSVSGFYILAAAQETGAEAAAPYPPAPLWFSPIQLPLMLPPTLQRC
jgi:hypothetical protein